MSTSLSPEFGSATRKLGFPRLGADLWAIAAAAWRALRPETMDGLIDLIERRYHAVHRSELPELIHLARRVEATHPGHPELPLGLAALLDRMRADLEEQMRKEEQILFPMMRRGGPGTITAPIDDMLAGHDDQGVYLHQLERLTRDFTAPEDACPAWQALYVGAEKLADDLMEHIRLEDSVLSPRFAGALRPAA